MIHLIRHYLLKSRLLCIACSLAILFFIYMRIWAITFFDAVRFKQVIEFFKDFEKFSAVPFAQLITYTGRVAQAFNEPVIITIIVIWAISRGSDCVAGQLNRGTLEMLLGNPISRRRIYWVQVLVTTTGTCLLASLAWTAMAFSVYTNTVTETIEPPSLEIPGTPFSIPLSLAEPETVEKPMSEFVDINQFWPAITILFAMGFFVAGFAMMVSSWDRYRWRTIGICIAFVVIQQMMRILGMAKPEYNFLLNYTFFNPFDPEGLVHIYVNQPELYWDFWLYRGDEIHRLSGLGCHLVLIGLGLLMYIIGDQVFTRRDLPAPV